MKLGASSKKRKQVPLNVVAEDSKPAILVTSETHPDVVHLHTQEEAKAAGLDLPDYVFHSGTPFYPAATRTAQDSVSLGPPPEFTLLTLQAFLRDSEASLHISYREGKFLVVGHRARDHKCMDVTTPDLAAGLRLFAEEMSK